VTRMSLSWVVLRAKTTCRPFLGVFLVFMSAEPYDRNPLSVSDCGVPCNEI
jgi:hypothetical protein